MYLVKLYKWNKALFVLTIFLICTQLFINLKRGMTATPFLHYGMYSQKFHLPKEIQVWEIYIDNRRLELSGLSPKNVDNIIEPARIFYSNRNSKELYETTIKRVLTSLKISPAKNEFDTDIPTPAFKEWFKTRLQNILNKNISNIKVYQNTYAVNDTLLAKIQTQLVYEIN